MAFCLKCKYKNQKGKPTEAGVPLVSLTGDRNQMQLLSQAAIAH